LNTSLSRRTSGRSTITLIGLAFLALVVNVDTAPVEAAYPGQNGRLAFISERDGNDEIYSVNLDGSDLRNLSSYALTDEIAVWSPDGTKIAFSRDVGNADYKIWVMNADGTDQHQISPEDSRDTDPTWSPDGTRIAFASTEGTPDVWVMDADGTNRMNLTNAVDWDLDPAWSPDGTQIAFRSERDGNAEIYVMNADGSDQTRLTFTPNGFDFNPKWSADGSRIYWDADGPFIHSIRPDGTDEETITTTPGSAGHPAPSPDGELIAFAGDDGLYTMKPDGTDINKVPAPAARTHCPIGSRWPDLRDR
jgi:Tol biopolymer transport system component